MKRKNIFILTTVALAVVAVVIWDIIHYIERTNYRATYRMAGRIEHLCRKGIVPEAKRDRALAALKHLGSIAESARIHYKLVSDGCPNAPAATLTDRQPVINLETYMQDAAVYSPVAGEVASVMASTGEFIGLSTPARFPTPATAGCNSASAKRTFRHSRPVRRSPPTSPSWIGRWR